MSGQMCMSIMWSRAAIRAAGPTISKIQDIIANDLRDILPKGRDDFLHVVESEGTLYLLRGEAQLEGWMVFCQIAKYKLLDPLRDDHPVLNLRGKSLKWPEAIESADNIEFEKIDDMS